VARRLHNWCRYGFRRLGEQDFEAVQWDWEGGSLSPWRLCSVRLQRVMAEECQRHTIRRQIRNCSQGVASARQCIGKYQDVKRCNAVQNRRGELDRSPTMSQSEALRAEDCNRDNHEFRRPARHAAGCASSLVHNRAGVIQMFPRRRALSV
jgi:hypothetical protein